MLKFEIIRTRIGQDIRLGNDIFPETTQIQSNNIKIF